MLWQRQVWESEEEAEARVCPLFVALYSSGSFVSSLVFSVVSEQVRQRALCSSK